MTFSCPTKHRLTFIARLAISLGILSARVLAGAGEEAPAGEKTLSRSLDTGKFARWSPEKRHAAEAALLARITADPDGSESRALQKKLKLADHRNRLIPSAAHPLILTDPVQRLRYFLHHAMEAARAARDPAFVAPAAREFPGAVEASAAREPAAKITILPHTGRQGLWEEDDTYFRPHATGYYAAPGEIITVTIPMDWVGKAKCVIGLHRDEPVMSGSFDEGGLHRDGFDLTKTTDLSSSVTRLSNPYGGPIFISIPNTDAAAPAFEITIGGAVRAPRFKSGATTPGEWREKLRDLPAPWAELESGSLLISLPSARIRQLDDPEAVLDFWDEVLAAEGELAALAEPRKVIEHLVVDCDVAAGYMFCGTDRIVIPNDDSLALFLNAGRLRQEGSWGHFHEMGHRHQFADIDFAGTEEVTVNLFTLYVYHKVLNQDHYECRKEADWGREAVAARIRTYLADPSFAEWQDDPFLALAFFVPILDEFGWDPIFRLYQDYRRWPRAAYPATEEQKRDFFYQHFSRALGRDLAGYFDHWAIPISKSARLPADEKRLPWLPRDWSK